MLIIMKDACVRIILFTLFIIYIYDEKRFYFVYQLYLTIMKTLSLILLLTFNIKSTINKLYRDIYLV